jgi:putative ABC transport system ATP-binding protein
VPVIDLKDVSKLYGFGDATTIALDEVSLSIDKGEFVAIMGASGSGKLNGTSVAKLRIGQRSKARRDKIGFVFQSFNLLPRLNVLENVALPLAYKNLTPVRRLKRAAVILERVGLADREFFMPRHLSGGQLQRAAIARALVNDPSILIADEPTGNLDSGSSRVVMELLSELHKDGNTILLVTHNPELTRYASRIVYMHDGAIIGDEQSAIGQVSKIAHRMITRLPKTTEEDDLAGVSALMKTIPGGDRITARTRKRKQPKVTRRSKTRTRKKAK